MVIFCSSSERIVDFVVGCSTYRCLHSQKRAKLDTSSTPPMCPQNASIGPTPPPNSTPTPTQTTTKSCRITDFSLCLVHTVTRAPGPFLRLLAPGIGGRPASKQHLSDVPGRWCLRFMVIRDNRGGGGGVGIDL